MKRADSEPPPSPDEAASASRTCSSSLTHLRPLDMAGRKKAWICSVGSRSTLFPRTLRCAPCLPRRCASFKYKLLARRGPCDPALPADCAQAALKKWSGIRAGRPNHHFVRSGAWTIQARSPEAAGARSPRVVRIRQLLEGQALHDLRRDLQSERVDPESRARGRRIEIGGQSRARPRGRRSC